MWKLAALLALAPPLTGCEARADCYRGCDAASKDAGGCCPMSTLPACPHAGQVRSELTRWTCCWPDQHLADGACAGTPSCPKGLVARGARCVRPPPPPPPPPAPRTVTLPDGRALIIAPALDAEGARALGHPPDPAGYSGAEVLAICDAASERDGLGTAYPEVEGVRRWDEAALGWRLPTAAEWAASGETGTVSNPVSNTVSNTASSTVSNTASSTVSNTESNTVPGTVYGWNEGVMIMGDAATARNLGPDERALAALRLVRWAP